MMTQKTNLTPQPVGFINVSEVYDLYYQKIYRYARYRLGDALQAEDISNEVFTRLLEAIRAKRGPAKNLQGWLFSTANHLVTDQIRAVYRSPQRDLDDSVPDVAAKPAEQLEESEEMRLLHEGLKLLTIDQQNVLALRFGTGSSVEETSRVLKKTSNAIKQIQFRAIRSLMRSLGKSN